MGYIQVLTEGHVATLTIDRPKALNALNSEVLAELDAAVDSLNLDEIRCLILTGAGEKSFVAGADIGEMSSLTKAEGEAFGKKGNDVFRKIETASKAGDIAVFAGKAPAGTDDGIFADWTERLRRHGVQVYLDADSELLIRGAKAHPALIKPNGAELSRLVGRSFSDVEEMADAARKLAADGIGTVVVSLGSDGALFVTRDTALRAEGLKVEVNSTVGWPPWPAAMSGA